jgi:AcrR family transcriptional regulator
VLTAASQLFYRQGIHAVGVDTIAAEAGATKAALYGNFGSKDRLVTAYLRARDQRWQQQIDEITAEHSDPRDRILAVFDAYEEWQSANDFRGCAFLNAAAEFPDRDHPVREVVRHHKDAMRSYLQAQLRRLGPDAEQVNATQLMLLLEGAVSTCMVTGDPQSYAEAKRLAASLLRPRTS